MRLTNSLETYGLIHQLLHWSTAFLIIAMFALGIYMHELPTGTEAEIADKLWLYSLHKTVGIATLAVALTRISWAIIQPHPGLLNHGVEALAAKTVHWLLYGAIIMMPVFGWLHHAATDGYAPIWWSLGDELPLVPNDPALAKFFGLAHWVTGIVLAMSLVLHIAGAIKHAAIDKDQTLARMVPGKYAETGKVPEKQSGSGKSFVLALSVFLAAGLATTGLYFYRTAGGEIETVARAQSENANWQINYDESNLEIEILQLGSPVKGRFGSWNASVVFDPQDLSDSSINAEVSIASLKLGDVSDRAISAEFLDATANPTANFVSEKITKSADGFVASGQLTLAGVTMPVELPFTFEETDGSADVTANLPITRLDFGVGKAFPDSSSVGETVTILIGIKASRLAPSS